MTELSYCDFAAVASDFDGVLKDSVSQHEEARRKAFKAMALECKDERFATIDSAIHEAAQSHGSHPSAIIGWVLSEAGIISSDNPADNPITVALVERKRELYRELAATGGTPIAGSLGFVRRWSTYRPGKEYMVTTAERKGEVLPFLIRHKLTRHFLDTRIIALEDSGPDRLKPDPWSYEEMLRRAELVDRPEQALAIEDSPNGIASANQAGLTVAAIPTSHTLDQLHKLTGVQRPDIIVASFDELGALLFR